MRNDAILSAPPGNVHDDDFEEGISFESLVQRRRELLATKPLISDEEVARLLAAYSGLEPVEVAALLLWAEKPQKRHPEPLRQPVGASKRQVGARKPSSAPYGPILIARSA